MKYFYLRAAASRINRRGGRGGKFGPRLDPISHLTLESIDVSETQLAITASRFPAQLNKIR